MLTPNDFRRIALGMDRAIERAHMGHPDFRVDGRIFATLHTGGKTGMVALTPDEQQRFMREDPASFMPESGAWGRQGCTRVRLDAVDEDTLGEAMTLAWQAAVMTQARKGSKPARAAKSVRVARKRGSKTPRLAGARSGQARRKG